MERRGLAVGALAAIAIGVVVWAIAARVRGPDGPRDGAAAPPEATLRLDGRVVDAEDRPVAGATVTISTVPPRTTVTEADGSFAFDGLRPWTYRIRARLDGDRAGPVLVRVGEASEPVRLRLRPGLSVAVRVVDAETGAPIAGARVAPSTWLDDVEPEVTTGPDGVAVLRGRDGRFDAIIQVRADGYATGYVMGPLQHDPGGVYETTVALRPQPGVIGGTVLGPDGAPVAGASVFARGVEGVTDAAGAWRITGVPIGAVSITARAPGFASSAPVVIDVDGPSPHDGIVLRLSAGAEVVGIVVDEGGRPVAAARVFSVFATERQAVTGPDGRFVLRGLEREEIAVAAASGDRASATVWVTPGAWDAHAVRLVLTGGTIAGVVVDATGAPAADVQVTARSREESLGAFRYLMVVTDDVGQFELGPVPAGTYALGASHRSVPRPGPPDRRHVIEVQPGTRDARIVLPATGTITGVVTREGAPAPVYAIAVGHDEDAVRSASTPKIVRAADGRFTVPRVSEGAWFVGIAVEGAARVIVPVEVLAGEVTDVGRVEPAGGAAVRGQVRDAGGRPVAGAVVRIGGTRDVGEEAGPGVTDRWVSVLGDRYVTTTDAAGRFAFATVGDRRGLRVRAAHPQLGRSVIVDVPPRGDVELSLGGAGAIAGVIAGATGERTVLARLLESEERPPPWWVTADARGRFRLDGLEPGRYRVSAGDDTAPVEVVVTAGATTEVTVAVTVTFVVRRGRVDCRSVVLRSADEEGGEGGGRDPLDGARAAGLCAGDEIELDGVVPGDYRLCVEGGRRPSCAPVTIAPAPARQTVDVTGW